MLALNEVASAAARGGSSTVTSQVGIAVVRVVGLIMLARVIAPSLFGFLAIAVSIVTIARLIVSMGLTSAAAQADHLSQAAKSSLFYINVTIGIIVGLIVAGIAPVLGEIYSSAQLAFMLAVMSPVPFLLGLQAQSQVELMRQLRFSGLAVSEFVSQLVAVVAAVGIALAGFEVWAAVALAVVQPAVSTASTLALARWLPGRMGAIRSEVVPVVAEGSRIMVVNLLRNVTRNIVVPILGLVASPAAVGNYDRAQQLSVTPVVMTVNSIQRVAVPVFAQVRESLSRLEKYQLASTTMLSYSAGIGFSLLAAVGQPLVLLLLGGDWYLASQLVSILALGGAFRVLGEANQWLFIGTGNSAANLRLNSIAQPAIVAATLAGLPWGVIGVAACNTIAWTIYAPIAIIVASRICGLPARPTLATSATGVFLVGMPVGLAAFVASRALDENNFISLLAGLVAGGLAFSALLLVPRVRTDFRDIFAAAKLVLARHQSD